jgi:phosphatidate phosphatase APP1
VHVSGYPGSGFFTADECGYLKIRLPADMQPGTVSIQVRLEMKGYVSTSAETAVQVWQMTNPSLGVISDIDDTLTPTQVTNKIDMIKNTLFHNTYNVKVFDGAAEALAAVAGKGDGLLPTLPVFYLSGSPWALHKRIADAFDRLDLPHGATILRRYSQEPFDPFHFKHPHLLVEIVDSNPGFQWVLFGDSGEKDPEVYHTLMEERPAAVKSVFIHNVTMATLTDERFRNFHLFNPENFALFDSWTEVSDAVQKRRLGLCGNLRSFNP